MHCTIDRTRNMPGCVVSDGQEVPAEAARMMKYMRSMFPRLQDRRRLPRLSYNAAGAIAGTEGAQEFWSHDINAYTIGYVSVKPIQCGVDGPVTLDLPNGARHETRGRVMRCREFAPGWFEGYIAFNTSLPIEVINMVKELGAEDEQ